MQSKDVKKSMDARNKASEAKNNVEAAQAEEVPTIPLGSLETINMLQPEVSFHSVASTRSVNMPVPLVVQPSEYHRSTNEWFQVWWDGIRPSYLLLSLVPVCVGSILAWVQTFTTKKTFGHFHVTHFISIVLAVILIQIGANLVNDYYDYLRGIDTSNTLGPGGLIQQGLIKPSRVLSLGLTALALGAIVGIIAAFAGGPLVYLLGVIGLLCAYFYSATTHSIASITFGEIVGFFLFGPLITLGAYLVMAQTHSVDRTTLIYSIPLGLLAAAAIHANNMRDIEGDAYARRRTIASILGLQRSRWLYITLISIAYLIVIGLAIPRSGPHFILLTLWTLPILIVALTSAIRSNTSAGLHFVMHQTLKLETYFGLLLIIAFFITAILQVLPTHLLP